MYNFIPKDKRIFITGGTGFLGRSLIERLSRYMCIPAYVLDPWRVNTPEHSKAIYGKVLPIHIERNIARSDGLAD